MFIVLISLSNKNYETPLNQYVQVNDAMEYIVNETMEYLWINMYKYIQLLVNVINLSITKKLV